MSLNRERLKALEKDYRNYKLEEIVTRYYDPDKIIKFKNSLIQNTDLVYPDPPAEGFLKFRAHFFALSKIIFGMMADTYAFNVTLLFINLFILYLILYFDLLSLTVKLIARFRNVKKD